MLICHAFFLQLLHAAELFFFIIKVAFLTVFVIKDHRINLHRGSVFFCSLFGFPLPTSFTCSASYCQKSSEPVRTQAQIQVRAFRRHGRALAGKDGLIWSAA